MVHIRKANGDLTLFDKTKFMSALVRSGASESDAFQVLSMVEKEIVEGMSTAKIYQLAQRYLLKVSKYVAGRYRLKRAVFDLGPGGYPFEKFVARLLEHKQYRVEINVVDQGKCVKHELDVLAENDKEKIMVECKFHRSKGHKNDVKVPLYIQSRFLDMKAAWLAGGEKRHMKGMIVTNTRFSLDAMAYAKCMELDLVSWDYPLGNCLRDWIDQSGFHPITSLRSLNKGLTGELLSEGIVLCRELIQHETVLLEKGLRPSQIRRIFHEAQTILGYS
jgi:Holliday junction resolvase-like predicted endonuclease